MSSLVRTIDRTEQRRRGAEAAAAARRAEMEQHKWAVEVIAQQKAREREAALRAAARARLAAAAAPPSELSELKSFVLRFTCDRAVRAMDAARDLNEENPKFKLAKHHYDTALRIYELKQKQEVREAGADNPVCEQTAFDRATWLEKGGRYEEGEVECRKVFDVRRTHLGRDHPAVADAALRLCENLLLHGPERQDEAMFLGERAVAFFAARQSRNLAAFGDRAGSDDNDDDDDDDEEEEEAAAEIQAEDDKKLLHALEVVAKCYGASDESGAEAKAYQMICNLKISMRRRRGDDD